MLRQEVLTILLVAADFSSMASTRVNISMGLTPGAPLL
jgi:hypothetical protein